MGVCIRRGAYPVSKEELIDLDPMEASFFKSENARLVGGMIRCIEC